MAKISSRHKTLIKFLHSNLLKPVVCFTWALNQTTFSEPCRTYHFKFVAKLIMFANLDRTQSFCAHREKAVPFLPTTIRRTSKEIGRRNERFLKFASHLICKLRSVDTWKECSKWGDHLSLLVRFISRCLT